MTETQQILKAITMVTGEHFFKTLAQYLCLETGAACMHIALYAKDDRNVMVSIFTDGPAQIAAPPMYFAANTFCHAIESEGGYYCCDRTNESNPHDYLLNTMKMSSCVAIPLYEEDVSCGIFAVMNGQPFKDTMLVRALLDCIAPRVALEARRKQMEAELKHHLWLAQTALDAIPTPIFFKDKEGAFSGWNRSFADFTGLPRSPEPHRPRLNGKIGIYDEQDRHLLQHGGTAVTETHVIRADGKRRNVLLHKAGFVTTDGQSHGGLVGTMIDVTDLRTAEQKADYLTYYDHLTSLPNRWMFQDRLANQISHARRNRERMAILTADLDHFKKIHSVFGHEKSDLLLKGVASRMQQTIREEDTVARFGVDSFTLLLNNIRFEEDAAIVSRKIHETLNKPFDLDGHEVFLSVSIGIALFPLDGDDVHTLIKNSELALHRAKEEGRNTHMFFAQEMNTRASEQLALQNHLRRALERNEFLLHYQPQYDAKTNEMIGVEALIRWNHPDLGMIHPDHFIHLAEHTGLIVPIGDWVLRTACLDAKAWNQMGNALIRVAVNISSRQFQQPCFFERIGQIIEQTGVDPNWLSLEITESTVMKDVDFTIQVLTKLKQLGTHLSIDDFGTGYSSLSYLKRFPVDQLKIDRSFIVDIPQEQDDIAIVAAVISMAHNLKLKVLAEGVETVEQKDFLNSVHCDEFQGFYFSRPVVLNSLFPQNAMASSMLSN